jgi:hypothetical protein
LCGHGDHEAKENPLKIIHPGLIDRIRGGQSDEGGDKPG